MTPQLMQAIQLLQIESSGTQRCSRTTTTLTSSGRQVSISPGARSQNIAER
ncbi:hypothetical protein CDO22_22005 (plasmid) [Sinorhizobium meliloti]|nr:hypothetical protein CDO24_32365 [Sinorhizobium meliloti]ASQ12714.1 hypothetical protein CDO22_22005 [Sinorhizobium meliloti]PTD30678.1 hypothetical protein C5N13_01205 [Sinorhizobium meliloti]